MNGSICIGWDFTHPSANDLLLVSSALFREIHNWKEARKKSRYTSIQVSLKELAHLAGMRTIKVKDILYILQDQDRIFLPQDFSRGRNGTRIDLGVHKGKVLAPTLTKRSLVDALCRYSAVEKKGNAEYTNRRWHRILEVTPDEQK